MLNEVFCFAVGYCQFVEYIRMLVMDNHKKPIFLCVLLTLGKHLLQFLLL